jgi:hypothetical protein
VGDPRHRAAGRRDLERLHRAEQRPDVGDGVRHQPEAAPTGLHDADRGAQPRLGRGQPEAQAQVQHRHHAAAQAEQAEHVPGAVGHRGQRRHPHHLDGAAQRQRVLAPLDAQQDHAGRGVGRFQVAPSGCWSLVSCQYRPAAGPG